MDAGWQKGPLIEQDVGILCLNRFGAQLVYLNQIASVVAAGVC